MTAQVMHRKLFETMDLSKLGHHHGPLNQHPHHLLQHNYPNLRVAHVQELHILLWHNRPDNIINISFIFGYLILCMIRIYKVCLTWKTSHALGTHTGLLIRDILRRLSHEKITFFVVRSGFIPTTLTQCRLILKTWPSTKTCGVWYCRMICCTTLPTCPATKPNTLFIGHWNDW